MAGGTAGCGDRGIRPGLDFGCRINPAQSGAADEASPQPIGKVTSGGFGPSINAPVAMGYLPVLHAGTGSLVFAELRGQRLPLQVTPLPFVAHAYHR